MSNLTSTAKPKPVRWLEIELNIKTVSEANRRDHWAVKAKRAKQQRATAKFECHDLLRLQMPLTVKLTRIAPRFLDDDNLRGAMKAIRDGIADALVIDDRDPRVKWEYEQMKGKPKQFAVLVYAEVA